MAEEVPGDGLDDLQDKFLEAAFSLRLVLPIDDEEVFPPEDLALLVLELDDHVGVDGDGRVVDLLLELEVFLGDALHLLEEGLLALEFATQLGVVAALHHYQDIIEGSRWIDPVI